MQSYKPSAANWQKKSIDWTRVLLLAAAIGFILGGVATLVRTPPPSGPLLSAKAIDAWKPTVHVQPKTCVAFVFDYQDLPWQCHDA